MRGGGVKASESHPPHPHPQIRATYDSIIMAAAKRRDELLMQVHATRSHKAEALQKELAQARGMLEHVRSVVGNVRKAAVVLTDTDVVGLHPMLESELLGMYESLSALPQQPLTDATLELKMDPVPALAAISSLGELVSHAMSAADVSVVGLSDGQIVGAGAQLSFALQVSPEARSRPWVQVRPALADLQKRLFIAITGLPPPGSGGSASASPLSPMSPMSPSSRALSPQRSGSSGEGGLADPAALGPASVIPVITSKPEAGELRLAFRVPQRCDKGGTVSISITVSGRPIPGLPIVLKTPRPGQVWAPARLAAAAAGNTTPCVGADGTVFVPIHSTNMVHVFNADGSVRGQPLPVTKHGVARLFHLAFDDASATLVLGSHNAPAPAAYRLVAINPATNALKVRAGAEGGGVRCRCA